MHDQVYANESYHVSGHRAIPYHGKVVKVFQDGDYKVLSVLNSTKRQKSNHVFANEAEAFNWLASGVVKVNSASYVECKDQLAVLAAEKSSLSSTQQSKKGTC